MSKYQRRLLQAGYPHEAQRFCCEVEKVFEEQFVSFKTDEQLKRHPREALRFCEAIRVQLGLMGLSDDLILGGLENYRKHYKKQAMAA